MPWKSASFAELACAISWRLSGASGGELNEAVLEALEAVRSHFDADQCGIMKFVNERGAAIIIARVAVPGIPPAPTHLDYGTHFPAVIRAHMTVPPRPYILDQLEDIEPADAIQLETSRALGLGAYVGIPILIGGEVRYSFALACNNRSYEWPRDQIPLMQVLGGTIANALEREREVARLRRSEADLAHAQRIAETGSWVRDFIPENPDLFSASEETYRIMGSRFVTRQERYELVHPEDRPRVTAARAQVLADRRPRYELEYRVVRPAGDVRIILEQGEVFFDEEGRPVRAIGTIRDLTESRRTERELHEVRARLLHTDRAARAGALGSSLSHELGQPLAAILANAQAGLRLMRDGRADLAELESILEAVVRDDKRAVAIIDGLRSLLRNDPVQRAPLDVGEALGEVVELLRGEIQGLGVVVESRFAPRCRALAVKAQVQQVGLNLLTNALAALRDRPAGTRRITIATTRSANGIEIAVADSGGGIDPARREAIFEPFHSTSRSGLGLGLAITRSIIEAHEGRIEVGTSEWGGALFRVTLPVLAGGDPAAESAVSSSAAAPAPRPSRDHAPLVCVVDDDAGLRDGLSRLLAATGYAPAVFASGEALLESPALPRAACVLLDVRLGAMSGPDLHQRLVASHPAMPVLFLTAHGDVATGVQAMRRGAVDFLLKPVDESSLMPALERAIRAGTAERARDEARRDATERLRELSPREREVLEHVVRGRLNKQIAGDLGIAEGTVKQHRGRVMQKLGARSVPDLVRICEAARETPHQSRMVEESPGE